MKIRPVGAGFSHADRRTDMMKLVVAFRSFANAPKEWPPSIIWLPVPSMIRYKCKGTGGTWLLCRYFFVFYGLVTQYWYFSLS